MCYIHIVYVVKEMTSFCGLGHLMGVAYTLMYVYIPEIIPILITIHFYITQVPLSTEGTVCSSNIDLCHDSTLTMSLGL